MHSFSPLKAVIWDMDGVLIDSLPTHCKAWRVILERYGYHYTYQQMTPYFGMTDTTVLRTIAGERFTDSEVSALAHEKEGIYQDMIVREAQPMAGVVAWLENFRAAGLKQALASSSVATSITLILDAMRLNAYFDAVVSGEGGPSKPNPLVFLRAAEQLGVLPQDCLVMEDAVVGVKAAKAAGMRCVAVTSTNPAEKLGEADLIVERFSQLTAASLHTMLEE